MKKKYFELSTFNKNKNLIGSDDLSEFIADRVY